MTNQNNYTISEEILEQLAEGGMESIPELIRILVNEAMGLERERYLQAERYERSED